MDFLESKDFDPNKVMECSFTDQLVFFDDPRERTRTQTFTYTKSCVHDDNGFQIFEELAYRSQSKFFSIF